MARAQLTQLIPAMAKATSAVVAGGDRTASPPGLAISAVRSALTAAGAGTVAGPAPPAGGSGTAHSPPLPAPVTTV